MSIETHGTTTKRWIIIMTVGIIPRRSKLVAMYV
jgi:hypothetical protein